MEETAAPRDIAERLALPPAGRVLLMERIILVNDRPAALAVDAIPARIAQAGARALPRTARCTGSWSTSAAWCSSGGVAQVSAVGADTPHGAPARGPKAEGPLLRMEQVERSASEEAVLYSLEHYVPSLLRPDRPSHPARGE